MTTWLQAANLKGTYTSEPTFISVGGDGTINKISWNATVPSGSKLHVQTSISWDNYEWSEWKSCTNGGEIPDLDVTVPVNQVYFKFRILLEASHYNTVPIFQDLSLFFEPIVIIHNDGETYCQPEIWITKVGNGDLTLTNTSDHNREFKFTDLINQETIYVNSEREHIDTSLPVTYRYNNFNDNYFNLPVGINVFKVEGMANFRFRYQFKRLQ
ncbi:phage tail domain-containing protein [Paenibacillus massiliensis]|uniref:phage tail domain-containing protein n=1 Tax=Paenibacillus massiliensis TaxID=225917 RepID=UPI0004266F03|nr:phage tail domain-containing protein [Paenibacillus massiliensis]